MKTITMNNVQIVQCDTIRLEHCGDVVFNKVSRNEDNILDQIYKSKYVRIFVMLI